MCPRFSRGSKEARALRVVGGRVGDEGNQRTIPHPKDRPVQELGLYLA